MSTELTPQEPAQVAPVQRSRFSDAQIAAADISNVAQLPDISQATKHFMPLNVDYWSPAEIGEEKLVYVIGIDYQSVPDMKTGEVIDLECVLMVERRGDQLMRLRNGSRILVGTIKDGIKTREILPGTTLTPVSVKYLGKRKSKAGNQCDNWQVTPLIIQ